MIGFRSASKYYYRPEGAEIILHEADISIERSEKIAILAGTGAGKTTIVRMLMGLESLNAGRVFTPGNGSWRLSDSSVLQPFLTGEQNVRIVADLFGLDPDWTSAFVLDLSELGNRYFSVLRQYSSSMRGTLGFALSMAIPFDFLVADQGMSVGQGRFRERCEAVLAERLESAGMILLTSNPSFARKHCESFGVLRAGQFLRCASYEEAAELFENEDEFEQINASIAAYPQEERLFRS